MDLQLRKGEWELKSFLLWKDRKRQKEENDKEVKERKERKERERRKRTRKWTRHRTRDVNKVEESVPKFIGTGKKKKLPHLFQNVFKFL